VIHDVYEICMAKEVLVSCKALNNSHNLSKLLELS